MVLPLMNWSKIMEERSKLSRNCGWVEEISPAFRTILQACCQDRRARKEHHAYVCNLLKHIKPIGWRLVSIEPPTNPLMQVNPTYYYVQTEVDKIQQSPYASKLLRCPRSGFKLSKIQNYFWSHEGGVSYPIFDGTAVCHRSMGCC